MTVQGALYFSDGELAAMQAHQDMHMMDTCTVDLYIDAGADVFGNPNPSWVASAPIQCGFFPQRPDEGTQNTNAPLLLAQLRLPIGTAVTSRDRITITHRHGVALAVPEQFMMIGEPKKGPSGLVCVLEVVTDGS